MMLGFCGTECGKCGRSALGGPDAIQHDANCPYSPQRKAMIDEAVRNVITEDHADDLPLKAITGRSFWRETLNGAGYGTFLGLMVSSIGPTIRDEFRRIQRRKRAYKYWSTSALGDSSDG